MNKKKDINLKTIINNLKEDFGSEISIFKEDSEEELLITGNKAIDKMLYGGLPFGCMHEFFGLSQTGKCVTLDTYIYTKESGLITIDDLVLPPTGNNLLTRTFFTELTEFIPSGNWWTLKKPQKVLGKNDFEIIDKFYFEKRTEVKRIITSSGFTIAGTPEHKIEVLDSIGNRVDKKLSDISKQDLIAIQLPNVKERKGDNKLPDVFELDFNDFPPDFSILNSLPTEMTRTLATISAILLSFYEYKENIFSPLPRQQFQLNRMKQKEIQKLLSIKLSKLLGQSYSDDYGDYLNKWRTSIFLYTLNAGIHLTFPIGARFVPHTISRATHDIIIQFITDFIFLNGRIEKDTFSVFSFSMYIMYFIKLYLESIGIRLKGFYTSRDDDSKIQYMNVITPFQITRPSIKFKKEEMAKFLKIIDLDYAENTYPEKFKSALKIASRALDKDLDYTIRTYDKVYKIQSYNAEVIDIELPEQHKYFTNGMISHNSFFMQKCLANSQKLFKPTIGIVLDRERAYTKKRAESLGIDTSKVILAKPSVIPTAVEGKNFVLETIKKIRSKDPEMEYYIVVIIDSLAAFMPPNLKGEDMGKKAKSIRAAFNELITVDKKTIVLFSNHVTFNPNIMFGNPKTKAGGTAPDYLRTCGIALEAKKYIKKDDKIIGVFLEIVIDKTRKGPSYSRTILPFYFKTGIPKWGGYDRYLVHKGILIPSSKKKYKSLTDMSFTYVFVDPKTNEKIKIPAEDQKQLIELYKKYEL